MDMPAKLLTIGVLVVIVAVAAGIGALTRWWVAPIVALAIVVAIYAWVASLHLGSR